MESIVEFFADLLLGIYVAIVDAIALIWPSTPESLKLATILSNLDTTSFTYHFVIEAAATVVLVISLVAVYKLVKILPFT